MPTGNPPYEPYYESECDSEQVTFDTQEHPPPMKPESMIVDLACTICKEHLVEIASPFSGDTQTLESDQEIVKLGEKPWATD
jgi:hypothetical protein